MLKKIYALNMAYKREGLVDLDDFFSDAHAEVKGDHLGTHDPLTARVNLVLSQLLGQGPVGQALSYWVGRTHDEGKVIIPDEIILGIKLLTPTERTIINLHPRRTVEITGTIPEFNEKYLIDGEEISVNIINRYHHERVDGKGYEGLQNPHILIRQTAIADAFSAMYENARKYNRRSNAIPDIIVRLLAGKGTQFDPEMVDRFVAYLLKVQTAADIKPDLGHIDAIFSGRGGPYCEEKQLFRYIEAFVGRKRELRPIVDGQEYLIKVNAEPYIICQDPDIAETLIYKIEGAEPRPLARIETKKMLFDKKTVLQRTGFSKKELKKAEAIIGKAGEHFYKFVDIHHSPQEVQQKIRGLGALSKDELRVCVEELLADVVNKESLIGLSEELFQILRKAGILDAEHNVNWRQPPFNSLLRKKLSHALKKAENNKLKKNRDILASGISKILKKKGICAISEKREKLFSFWQETKAQAVKVLGNELTEREEAQLFPLIDYIPKLNVRGVPTDKLETFIDGFVGQLYPEGEEKELKGKKELIYQILLMYYYLFNITLLDEKHYMPSRQEVLNNLHTVGEKCELMRERYPALEPILRFTAEVCRGDYNINKGRWRKAALYSEEANIALIISNFIVSNGNIIYVDKKIPGSKTKTAFFQWLSANELLINPRMEKYWQRLKRQGLTFGPARP